MDGPSTSGYRPFANYEPRSRDERVNARDHTALEKARIAARSYGRAEPPPANVLIPQTNSPLYCDDHSRFGAPDAATLEYQRRQEQLKRQEVSRASARRRGLPFRGFGGRRRCQRRRGPEAGLFVSKVCMHMCCVPLA